MNKNLLIILGVCAIAIIGGGAYASMRNKAEVPQDNTVQIEAMADNQKELMQEQGDQYQSDTDDEGSNDGDMIDQNTTKTDSSSSVVTPSTQTTQAGSYEVYSPEKISRASTGKVVLFFRASWCPTCKTLDADIKAHLSSIPNDLTILDVNYDNSSDLKKKYGVTYQHTLVQVDKDGNMIKKWSGGATLVSIVTQIK